MRQRIYDWWLKLTCRHSYEAIGMAYGGVKYRCQHCPKLIVREKGWQPK